MADDLVPLAAYPNPVQANEAVRRLKEAGIPAVLTDESVGGLDAYLGSGIGWTSCVSASRT